MYEREDCAHRHELAAFREVGATALDVSADSPFSQGPFREEHRIDFELVSDMVRAVIQSYGFEIDFSELGLHGIANRALFVFGEDGTITYHWITNDPTNELNYQKRLTATQTT